MARSFGTSSRVSRAASSIVLAAAACFALVGAASDPIVAKDLEPRAAGEAIRVEGFAKVEPWRAEFEARLARVVDVELEAGQMSIHDVYAIHGSRANLSDRRRAGFTIRYMPASSLYDRSIKMMGAAKGLRQDMSRRPIYLVRGRDRAGNDFQCGQDEPFSVGVAD